VSSIRIHGASCTGACGQDRQHQLTQTDHQPHQQRRPDQRGDNDERRALLRALSILSDPPRHLAIAIEACRTNVQTVFEGIACENSYPFHYFPDKNFNQLVLKALFTGVPLRRVMGLEQRITADLVRMTEDYASERRAARRFVPEDIELITANQRVQR